MLSDVIPNLRMKAVDALLEIEDRGGSALLEQKFSRLDFTPTALRNWWDGTCDDVKISQLVALLDALGQSLILTVVDRRSNERSHFPIPAVAPQPNGPPATHPALRPGRRIGSLPAGAVFGRPDPDAVDPTIGAALPSPLAPAAFGGVVRDQPEHLLSVPTADPSLARGG